MPFADLSSSIPKKKNAVHVEMPSGEIGLVSAWFILNNQSGLPPATPQVSRQQPNGLLV